MRPTPRTRSARLGRLILAAALAATAPEGDAASRPGGGQVATLADASADSGIDFRYESGSRGRLDLPEIMGGGVGLIDAEGDGDLDVYLAQGGPIVPGPGLADPPCRLYINDGAGRFTPAGDRGCPGPSYAMGVAVGDFDSDRRDDLFVTGWGDQRLYRNRGDGTFEDVTKRAGVESSLWSTSAAWADLDGDGDLDLYVAGYLDYDPTVAPFCAAPDGKRDYCGPEDFPAHADRLYRNDGDGTFHDVWAETGLTLTEGRGLGVLIAQLVGDPRPDIFVANDGTPCWLLENLGNLRFREVAADAGVAVDGQGRSLAAMGVSLGDVDSDGRLDLAVTNFFDRSTVAFRSLAPGQFVDASPGSGIATITRPVNGFGVALVDLDGDGRDDLLQANGHVLDRARLGVPFAMPATLAWNRDGRFVRGDLPGDAGRPRLGRGLVTGDLDRDGRPDAILTSLDRAPLVLHSSGTNHWLAIRLEDRAGRANPPVGSIVTVRCGEARQVRQLFAGGSYLSASSRALWFGLGARERADSVEIRWPDGSIETLKGVAAKGEVVIRHQ